MSACQQNNHLSNNYRLKKVALKMNKYVKNNNKKSKTFLQKIKVAGLINKPTMMARWNTK